MEFFSDMVYLGKPKHLAYLIPNVTNTLFVQTKNQIEFSHAKLVLSLFPDLDNSQKKE